MGEEIQRKKRASIKERWETRDRNKEENKMEGDVLTVCGAKQREFSCQVTARRHW